jgi:hypothetical protein
MRKKTTSRAPRITPTTIQRERLRQARSSFNCQLGLAYVCAGTTLVGLILLLSGRVAPGLFTSIGGLTGMTTAVNQVSRMTRDANDRLDSQFKQKPTQSKLRQSRRKADNDKAA